MMMMMALMMIMMMMTFKVNGESCVYLTIWFRVFSYGLSNIQIILLWSVKYPDNTLMVCQISK